MQAYSQDLRYRILCAMDQRKPRAEIAKTFAVSQSTIKRYLKLRRETGGIKPRAIPGRPSRKGAAQRAGLLPQLEAHPDATLVVHRQLWETTHGVQISCATLSRAIRRLNWTPRKRPYTQVSRMKPSASLGESKPNGSVRTGNTEKFIRMRKMLPYRSWNYEALALADIFSGCSPRLVWPALV